MNKYDDLVKAVASLFWSVIKYVVALCGLLRVAWSHDDVHLQLYGISLLLFAIFINMRDGREGE